MFDNTKLPLRTKHLAQYGVNPNKNGSAAMDLKRQLGGKYTTAWVIKLTQAMREWNARQPLHGALGLDDA